MTPMILAIDDDDANLQLLRDVCDTLGFRVETENDSSRAVVHARNTRPDVILLDMLMPRTGGLELLEALQSDAELAAIPVVFVTAVNDGKSEQRAFELGAADYIRKPFRLVELQARIYTALEIASYRTGRARAAAWSDALRSEAEALARRASAGERFGCAVVTLDGFADLARRDRERSAAVLAALARSMRRSIRGRDTLFLARARGDEHPDEPEFILFFPASDHAGVVRAVERLASGAASLNMRGEKIPVEARFGYLTVPHAAVETVSDILAAARRAAASARERGLAVVEFRAE